MFSSNTSGPGVATDPQFNYVTMLLPGNGTNGAQNNTFLDSSTNNFSITRNGNTTQGTFSPYGSNWSNYFDGSGDYLSGIGTTSSFNFMHNSSALFTAECWVYFSSTASEQYLFSNNGGASANIGCALSVVAGGALSLFITRGVSGVGNVTAYVTSSGTVPTNQWVHIAVTYDQSQASSNAKFYINGASAGTGNKTGNSPSGSNATNALTVAAATSAGLSPVSGYVSNLRIVNSIVYTAAFTPPTSPLTAITNTSLLTCQSNRFIDNSSNAFTITVNGDVSVQRFSPFSPTAPYAAGTDGGSGYFDGSGDYLTLSYSTSAFDWWTGDYTLEAWVYPENFDGFYYSTNFPCFIGNIDPTTASNPDNRWSFGILADGTVRFYYYNGSANYVSSSSGSAKVNQWNHIAMTKTSSGVSIFANGVGTSPVAVSGTPQSTTGQPLVVGGIAAASSRIKGSVNGVRIVKGTSVYSGTTYTVPTAPLTAITNTSLLLNFTNAGIIDNAEMNDLETVGNAQISTAQSKFGGGSMAFDGTGDWLISPYNVSNEFGSGNLTIELWLQTATTGQYATLISKSPASFSFGMWALQINGASASSGNVVFYAGDFNGGVPLMTTSGVSVIDNNWHHIAVVRNGSSWAIYVDGVSRATATWTGTITTLSGSIYIGADQFYSGRTITGYIDDLRITKGYARYTANFTPPSAPFPTQ